MIEGTWIKFVLVERKIKTDVYNVMTKGDGDIVLGQTRWFSRWRTYSFFPCNDTVYESKCLADIIQFMKELMKKRQDARFFDKNSSSG